MTRRKLVALTTSPLPIPGQITDGPGFRMWNLLVEVAKHHDVRILSIYESLHLGVRQGGPVRVGALTVESVSHNPLSVGRRVRSLAPDVLFLPWSSVGFLGGSNRSIPTIVDYVGPGLLEHFAATGRVPIPMRNLKLDSFWYGDFFLTTTQRERFYLIGMLAASGRLSRPSFGRHDPLVHAVRMTPPEDGLPGVHRSRSAASEPLVVLLAGAFLPWYDYDLVADAIGELPPEARSGVRIRVLGGNPRMPEMERAVNARLGRGVPGEVCDLLGVVPFNERGRYYQDADVGLCLASNSVEDDLSSRTRVVDFLGAHLPVLTEGKDEYSQLALAGGAGFQYEHSAASLATLLERLRADPALAARARDAAPEVVAQSFNVGLEASPVLKFLENPILTTRAPRMNSSVQMFGLWVSDVLSALRSRAKR